MSQSNYTFTITGNMGVTGEQVIAAMRKYGRRNAYRPDDDSDGSAGVAALVPAAPNQGGGGMYLNEPVAP